MKLSALQAAEIEAHIGRAMQETVAVETYSGENAYGPVLATSVNKTCNVIAKRRLVRNPDGEEVVSEFTLHVDPDDETAFTPDSTVTIASRASTVLAVSPKSYNGQTVYVEVACS